MGPPRRVVAAGLYRWVRNPIYPSALTVILGEAWLFRTTALLLYRAAMAVCFHLFVISQAGPGRHGLAATADPLNREIDSGGYATPSSSGEQSVVVRIP